jgi:hypothetical protein
VKEWEYRGGKIAITDRAFKVDAEGTHDAIFLAEITAVMQQSHGNGYRNLTIVFHGGKLSWDEEPADTGDELPPR